MITIHAKIAVVLGLILAGTVYFRNRREDFNGPILLFKTKKFLNFIDKLSKLSKTFWKAYSTVGILAGFLFMFMIFSTLISNATSIAKTPEASQGVMLAIPGVTIPFIGPLIALIVLVIVHEFSHGIMARIEEVKLKSVGVALLGFLPVGAFVDPDEDQLKELKPLKQLRVYAAGAFSNIVLSFLILILLLFVIMPVFIQPMEGVKITEVEEGLPAKQAGLQKGSMIEGVEGKKTSDIFEFTSAMNSLELEPADRVQLKTEEKTYNIKTTSKNGQAYIGIRFCSQVSSKDIATLFTLAGPIVLIKNTLINPACYPVKYGSPEIFWSIFGVLKWTIVLNFAVGMINLLPIKPLDGGLMIETVAEKFSKSEKVVKTIVYSISLIGFGVLLINLLGPSAWKIFNIIG